ncbi:MAG: 50S ribosomal protein L4 [Promethearchaeota archaeon]|nr:MAG: 50S ribosomal protein L4 [Candidatus Lokiarchaeota archaeon]
MEKVNVYSLDGKKKGLIDIPNIFKINPRKDLVQKANEIFESRNKQIQGRDKRAGLKNTAASWGTGHGISRAPRIKGSGFSTARNVGRVPFAVGGRRTHPIKKEKSLNKKINKKTYALSLISAISASGNVDWVKIRGHKIDNIPELPLVVDDKIQTVKKTSAAFKIFSDLGLTEDLKKSKESKKVRAGKGKRRGRKYKKKKGILFVIKEDFGIVKATRNIPGIEIVKYENISINNLAPGGSLGRLILWSQSAFDELNNIEVMI